MNRPPCFGFTKPLDKSRAGEYALPLELLRLAPSASNKQPWRVVHAGGAYYFFAAHDKAHSVYPFDIQKLDVGIAMCHFEQSALALGLHGCWDDRAPAFAVPSPSVEHVITWLPE